MSEQGKFGEPFKVEDYNAPLGDTGDFEPQIVVSDDEGHELFRVYDIDGKPDIEADHIYNAVKRMVACANACAGMDDPAAEIARLRAEVERLRGRISSACEMAEEIDEAAALWEFLAASFDEEDRAALEPKS